MVLIFLPVFAISTCVYIEIYFYMFLGLMVKGQRHVEILGRYRTITPVGRSLHHYGSFDVDLSRERLNLRSTHFATVWLVQLPKGLSISVLILHP